MEALKDWLQRMEDGTAETDSLLLRVRLPLESPNPNPYDNTSLIAYPEAGGWVEEKARSFAYYAKIGRRDSFVLSAVTTALTGTIDGSGRLRRIRLAAGGGKTIPRRYPVAEARLGGAIADDHAVRLLHGMLMEILHPGASLLLSDDYRKRTAANVAASHLWRAIREFAQREEGSDAAESTEQRQPLACQAGRPDAFHLYKHSHSKMGTGGKASGRYGSDTDRDSE